MEETSNFHVHKYVDQTDVDHDEMYIKGVPLKTIWMSLGLTRRFSWTGWKLWPNNLKRTFYQYYVFVIFMYLPTYLYLIRTSNKHLFLGICSISACLEIFYSHTAPVPSTCCKIWAGVQALVETTLRRVLMFNGFIKWSLLKLLNFEGRYFLSP